MENIDALVKMGYTLDEIRQAHSEGFFTTNEIIDFITEKRDKTPRLKLNTLPKNPPVLPFVPINLNEDEKLEVEERKQEAKALYQKNLEEKKRDMEYKKRILDQIRDDRSVQPSSFQVSSSPNPSNNQDSNRGNNFRIRFNMNDSTPLVHSFTNESKIKELIDILDGLVKNMPSICSEPSLTLKCLIFEIASFPRKQINITELFEKQGENLIHLSYLINSTLFIRHNSRLCTSRSEVNQIPSDVPREEHQNEALDEPEDRDSLEEEHNDLFPMPVDEPVNENDMDPDFNDLENDLNEGHGEHPQSPFLGQGQRISDQVFLNDEDRERDFQERRQRFLNNLEQSEKPMLVEEHPIHGLAYNPLNLIDLCLNYITSIISRIIQVSTSARIGIPGTQEDSSLIATPGEVKVFNDLKTTLLPNFLCQKIIVILKEQNLVNIKTAALFKHSLEELNLDSYPLMTGDLFSHVAKNFYELRKLSLNGIDTGSLPPASLNDFMHMKKLTHLSLSNLSSVNKDTLPSILKVASLKYLNLSQTKLNDEAWCQFNPDHHLMLTELNVSGLNHNYSITDIGFWHILRVIPNLVKLNCSRNKIKGQIDLQPKCFNFNRSSLKSLNLSGNEELTRIPECSSILEHASLNQCYNFSISSLINYCRRYGKSIQKIDGIFNLSDVNKDTILEFFSLSLPLDEYDLSHLNGPWMNVETLLSIVVHINKDSVKILNLPQRKLTETTDHASSSVLLDCLSGMRNLEELNLGDQLTWLDLEELNNFLRFSRLLNVVSIKTSSKFLANALEKSLRSECKLRVQLLIDTD